MIASSKSTKDGGGRGEANSKFSEEPVLNEVSTSYKSKDGTQSKFPSGPSPLKKAIKENENSIIQSILSPTSQKNNNNGNDGMSPLLDYLFEDGQLTRIEFDLVDKAIGIDTPNEQAQALLRILETKDDEALAVLLEYLRSNRQDPSTSDTILKLSTTFLPARNGGLHSKYYHTTGGLPIQTGSSSSISKAGIGIREVIEVTRRHSLNSRLNKNGMDEEGDRIVRVPFTVNRSCGGSIAGKRESHHDFYYGRNCTFPLTCKKIQEENDNEKIAKEDDDDSEKSREEDDDEMDEDEEWDWLGYMSSSNIENSGEPQQNKKEITDFRDFYLTNACLETVRRQIHFSCPESLTASSWQRVLKNMNGLLNTDVQPIKDLLLNLNSLEYQNQIKAEQRKLSKTSKAANNKEVIQETVNPSKTLHAFHVNWDQILYHSFQVWKLRNGLNSTFYSLIGLFQHSHLYQTADHLLSHKMSIQARESEKDVEDNVIVDGKGNRFSKRLSSSSTIMLEKSDFLRKFYSPTNSKRGGNNVVAPTGPLSTNRERVSVSPVLSLDLSEDLF